MRRKNNISYVSNEGRGVNIKFIIIPKYFIFEAILHLKGGWFHASLNMCILKNVLLSICEYVKNALLIFEYK